MCVPIPFCSLALAKGIKNPPFPLIGVTFRQIMKQFSLWMAAKSLAWPCLPQDYAFQDKTFVVHDGTWKPT
jgi:hypothetical protein